MSGSRPATLGTENNGGGGGRLSGCMASLPITTRFIIGLCFVVFVYTPLVYETEWTLFLCPWRVLEENEWLRIITSTYIHGGQARGIPHIGMNMMATYFILGMRVEPVYGSMCALGQVILFTLLNGLMYVFLYKCGQWAGQSWNTCSVGFSGVIFSLLMSELATLPAGATRSLCGFCNVPAWIYPWVLLCLLYFLPGVSFMGHFAGICIGFMYSRGWLNFLTFKRSWILKMEAWEWWQPLMNLSIYHRCPSEPVVPDPFVGEYCPQLPDNPCAGLVACWQQCCTKGQESIREHARARRVQNNNGYAPVSSSEMDAATSSSEMELDDVMVVSAGESTPWRPPTAPTTTIVAPSSSAAAAAAAAAAASSSSSSSTKKNKKGGSNAPPQEHRRPHHESRLLKKSPSSSS